MSVDQNIKFQTEICSEINCLIAPECQDDDEEGIPRRLLVCLPLILKKSQSKPSSGTPEMLELLIKNLVIGCGQSPFR